MVVFSWYVCCGGGHERCVCSKGGFPHVREIDVVICGGGFDKVSIHLDTVASPSDVMECLHGLYVYCGICLVVYVYYGFEGWFYKLVGEAYNSLLCCLAF